MDGRAERLQRLFGDPGVAPLVARLRGRLARGLPLAGDVTLHGLAAKERDALAALLGRAPGRLRSRSVRVSLDALEERLRAARICGSLREAVEAVGGPVVDGRSQRAALAAAWTDVFAVARREPVYAGRLRAWLTEVEQTGLLKRLTGGDIGTATRVLSDVARVAAALPGNGDPLAALAARTIGDAHALDPGTPVATLAVRAAAVLGRADFTNTAEGRRAAWASVGVLCDELGTPVLVLNLPSASGTPLGRLLREAAAAGEPLHVSLRLLLRHPVAAGAGFHARNVYVCENRTIVALAAARLGARCAPLVCTDGQPATPQQVLLQQLAAAGVMLHHHGDFDWGGIRIARQMIQQFGARPWRMGTADYLGAVGRGTRLVRVPPESPWDPTLALAMARQRCAVHEEAVAELLLADLERAGSPGSFDGTTVPWTS
jgi:uncharacterized protein (TIGR02679 family)